MFKKWWINRIHPQLKEIVLEAERHGWHVSYSYFNNSVTIDNQQWSVLAGRKEVFDAKTGQLLERIIN